MNIEDRAEKWADENTACDAEKLVAVAAYLAGSAQAQADYSVPVQSWPGAGAPCERHNELGCAWCIPGPYEYPQPDPR